MSGLLTACVGAPSGVVNIAGGFGSDDTLSAPADASAQIRFESDGDVVDITSGGSADVGDWITPKAVAPGDYEIMAHQNSGDALDGGSSALDAWLALTSARSWSVTVSAIGEKSANLTVSIRRGGVTLSSGTVTLHAQSI